MISRIWYGWTSSASAVVYIALVAFGAFLVGK
jgi:hypothetical protein